MAGLSEMVARLPRAARAAALEPVAERLGALAAYLQERAREEHAWRSRDGALEESITAFVTEADAGQAGGVVLQASAPYARFVELARGGRWAWLWPVLMNHQDDILALLGGGAAADGPAGEQASSLGSYRGVERVEHTEQ